MKSIKLGLFTLLIFSTGLIAQGQGKGQGRGRGFFDFLLSPKFILMFIIALIALGLLLLKRMNNRVRITLLLISTFLFGFAGNIGGSFFSNFAMHPSPICAATKPFLFGLKIPFIVTLFVIFLLTFIGPKLFCSYVCPVGALQELISIFANKLKIKRNKISFTITNRVRILLFLVFIFIFATGVMTVTVNGREYNDSLYNYINPFHGMELEWTNNLLDNLIHYLPFILTIILAFKLYRPFCHFACPIGLYTHYMEHAAVLKYGKIKTKEDFCKSCGICIKKSPCQAIDDIVKEARLRPDCYACDECVKACPKNILKVKV